MFLHYQRTMAIILFKAFDCSYDSVTVEGLCSLLSTTHERLEQFVYRNMKLVLNCLLDFAETYVKGSFFEHYTNYPSICFCDMLFVRVFGCAFAKEGKNFENLLSELCDEDGLDPCEKHRKWLLFMGLLMECIVTERPDTILIDEFCSSPEEPCEKAVDFCLKVLSEVTPKH